VIVADAVGTDLFRAVLQGAPPGAVYALVALGFVLAYKTSGVFNLAFGAQAYVSAVVYYQAHTEWGWDILPAFLLSVVLIAPLLGFLLEWLIFRHLRTAPAVAKLVVTIGLALALPNIVDLLFGFEVVAGRTPEGIAPDGASVFYDPFGVYAFSRNEVVTMAVAVVAMLALGALFRFSAIGLRMRAVVESPRMTELNGVAADRVSAFAWALSSFFAGLAGVLIAPRFNTLAAGEFFNIVVVAVTAAAIGGLVSLPRALAGGLGLGILIALFTTFLPQWSDDWPWLLPIQDNLTPALPFVVLFAILVFVPGIRRTREAGDPLAGVSPPPPPLGVALTDERRLLITRLLGTAAIVAVLAVVLTQADSVWMFLVTQAVVVSIIYLSVTVITGLAGQISLCQGTFAAIGAFTVFQLVERQGMSSIAAAFVGAGIAAVVGAVLSLPIRRLNGIWVAIATLAFAFFFDSVMVKLSWVGGSSTEATGVPRPVIGPWDFGSDKAFLALAVVILVVAAVAVTQLSAGTFGQQLRALSGSEVAAQSIGISPARARIAAFAVSAFIAGLGGALLAIHQESVNYTTNFAPFATLFWLVLVVTIGTRSVSGAVGAAMVFSIFDTLILKGTFLGWILRSPERIPDLFPVSPKWRFILFGLGTIAFARHPEGPIEAQRRKRAAARAERAAAEAPVPAAEEPSEPRPAEVTEPVA
jgi:branched-subunit amino acid ABC-type transport system permease component